MSKLHLIECDELYEDLKADYVSYGTMFERYFRGLDSDLTFDYASAINRSLPKPKANHVYLVTGSKFGAYEDHVWITELQAWILQAYKLGARLIGVCFGHQIIAQALGGKVMNSPKGWGVGVRALPIKCHQDLPNPLKLIYSHQDQVVTLPDSAECLIGDDFCPYAGFTIGRQVITFQGHPEFNGTYTQRLLGRRADAIGQPLFDNAMASLSIQPHNDQVGNFLLDWIKQSALNVYHQPSEQEV